MSETSSADLGLPPLDQVSYVVADMDKALARFAPVYGDFTVLDSVPLEGTLYRGQLSDVVLKLGFGRSGPVEIELVEVLSGESPHTEFLRERGEGQHHVRFTVTDLDAVIESAEAAGFESIWSHAMPGIRFAYLEREDTVIELVENSSE